MGLRLTALAMALALVAFAAARFVKREYRVEGREYYAFCPVFTEDIDEAKSAAISDAASKGAGMVINANGGYYVAAACYKTYAEAEKVAEKNGGEVLNLKIKDIATTDEKNASEVKKKYEAAFLYADAMIDYSLAAAAAGSSPPSCGIVESAAAEYFRSSAEELCPGYTDAESKARFLACKIVAELSDGAQ